MDAHYLCQQSLRCKVSHPIQNRRPPRRRERGRGGFGGPWGASAPKPSGEPLSYPRGGGGGGQREDKASTPASPPGGGGKERTRRARLHPHPGRAVVYQAKTDEEREREERRERREVGWVWGRLIWTVSQRPETLRPQKKSGPVSTCVVLVRTTQAQQERHVGPPPPPTPVRKDSIAHVLIAIGRAASGGWAWKRKEGDWSTSPPCPRGRKMLDGLPLPPPSSATHSKQTNEGGCVFISPFVIRTMHSR